MSVRQASGRFIASSELSASGGAYSSPPSKPAPEWKASTIAHTASSGSQAWKKLNPAVMVAAKKTAVQADSTTKRHRHASNPDRTREENAHRRLEHHQPAPGKLQESQFGQRLPDGHRDRESGARARPAGISASGSHQRSRLHARQACHAASSPARPREPPQSWSPRWLKP